jgi:hypothetical protein
VKITHFSMFFRPESQHPGSQSQQQGLLQYRALRFSQLELRSYDLRKAVEKMDGLSRPGQYSGDITEIFSPLSKHGLSCLIYGKK